MQMRLVSAVESGRTLESGREKLWCIVGREETFDHVASSGLLGMKLQGVVCFQWP